MTSKAAGDIKGTIASRNGTEVTSVVLKDAVRTPSAQFNLLSLTKLTSEGWNLVVSKNKLEI